MRTRREYRPISCTATRALAAIQLIADGRPLGTLVTTVSAPPVTAAKALMAARDLPAAIPEPDRATAYEALGRLGAIPPRNLTVGRCCRALLQEAVAKRHVPVLQC